MPLNLYEAQHGVTEITADLSDQATVSVGPYEYLEFYHPQATNYAESGLYTAPGRCDNVSPEYTSSGCIYPEASLTFTESASGNESSSGYTPAPGNAQFPFASTYENTGPGTADVGHVSLTDNSNGGNQSREISSRESGTGLRSILRPDR